VLVVVIVVDVVRGVELEAGKVTPGNPPTPVVKAAGVPVTRCRSGVAAPDVATTTGVPKLRARVGYGVGPITIVPVIGTDVELVTGLVARVGALPKSGCSVLVKLGVTVASSAGVVVTALRTRLKAPTSTVGVGVGSSFVSTGAGG
jgi:hypothetical protein